MPTTWTDTLLSERSFNIYPIFNQGFRNTRIVLKNKRMAFSDNIQRGICTALYDSMDFWEEISDIVSEDFMA